MDTPQKPPLVFANRVIRMMVDHSGGEEMVTLPDDYTALRVAFRRLGGSWERVMHGDMPQIRMLRKVVDTWCKMPGRKKDNEFTELV